MNYPYRQFKCDVLPWAFLALILTIPSAPCLATTQVVLFTGFGSSPNTGTGMDILNSTLAASTIPNYTGMVFAWNNREAASSWVQQQSDRTTLVLIGHSFGANSALQLANNFLKPQGIDVDLTVQIDSVENFYGGWNDTLPTNVEEGLNYYQNSTGFFEPQGEDIVQGATNLNAEVLFNDTSITHTSLDDDSRLHALITQNILDNLNTENADFNNSGLVDGFDFLRWQRNYGNLGTATLSTGDANGDANVDQLDLAIWSAQFGTNPAIIASIQVVPEPGSGVLFTAISLALLLKRSRAY